MPTANIKSAYFNFGDGRTSTELNPNHSYTMPGTYTWRAVITDITGVVTKLSGTVYVYDFDYFNDTLHVANTDHCYRFALKSLQGIGGVQWGGTNWLWPTAYSGTCRGTNNSGETLNLVCNNKNGKFYRIGVESTWQDRISGSYQGNDIEGYFRIKEFTAPAGEYQETEHIESHIHMRPFWETDRSTSGHTVDGFLTNYALELRMYENGEQTTPNEKIVNVPRYGDYVYRKRVEARRLQLEVYTYSSSWRCIKVQQRFMPIDKSAAPGYDYPQENQWQYEFTGRYFWVSRDTVKPTLNRSTGVVCLGSYASLTLGPDGNLKSAMVFAPSQGLYSTGIVSNTGDWTASIFVSGVLLPMTLWQMTVSNGATLNIKLVNVGGVYNLLFSDGTTYQLRGLSWNGSGWVNIAVQKSGTGIYIYENGVLVTSFILSNATLGYGGTVGFAMNSTCTAFDPVLVPRAISSGALKYYYDDVVNNSGDGGLLPIYR